MRKPKKVKLNIRLDPELYEMLCGLRPLYPDFTNALEDCLRDWRGSTWHFLKMEKLRLLQRNLLETEQKFNPSKNIPD